MIIVKVNANKKNGQKIATVPAKCNIEAGDYIIIEKVEEKKK